MQIHTNQYIVQLKSTKNVLNNLIHPIYLCKSHLDLKSQALHTAISQSHSSFLFLLFYSTYQLPKSWNEKYLNQVQDRCDVTLSRIKAYLVVMNQTIDLLGSVVYQVSLVNIIRVKVHDQQWEREISFFFVGSFKFSVTI